MKMQADVQYNDFRGTSAADISDHTDLVRLAIKQKIDVKRFEPIGATFYHGYSRFFTVSLLCIDTSKSKGDDKHIVTIMLDDVKPTEFFDIFKRFSVHVHKTNFGFENMEIKEELMQTDLV